MAGSTRNKDDGSGYQGTSPKSNYSSRAREGFNKTVDRNQRANGYTPKSDMEQSVNRAGKGSRLAGPMSGTATSWMGTNKRQQVVAPKMKMKPKPVVAAPAKKASAPAKSGRTINAPMSTKQAQSMKPGNYSNMSVSMNGKTYKGFTVGSTTDSKGRTTKSVGNWSSSPSRSSGSTASKSVSSSRAPNPANSRNMRNW